MDRKQKSHAADHWLACQPRPSHVDDCGRREAWPGAHELGEAPFGAFLVSRTQTDRL